MDVSIVTDSWGASRGGRERYLAALSRGLVARGHRVEVFCRAAEVPDPRVHVAPRGGPYPAARERSFQDWLARAGLSGAILAARPFPAATHVQLHGGLLASAFRAERAALPEGLRKAFFPLAGRLNGRRRLLLRAEAEMLGKRPPPRVMVWSRHLGEEVRRLFPGLESVAVSVPAIALRSRTSGSGPQPRPGPPRLRLLFAAHNFRLKGLEPLLRAVALGRSEGLDVQLAVAGRDSPRPFRRLAAALGIRDDVRFLGAVEAEGMADLMEWSDALVHPTFHDPFSLVCLESIWAGRPVVTTLGNGVSEWIRDGHEGFVLEDPCDFAGLARALAALCDHDRLRVMGEKAAARARLFDPGDHLETVTAWLAQGPLPPAAGQAQISTRPVPPVGGAPSSSVR